MTEHRLERTGKPALVFTGGLLAESSGKWVSGKVQNRWHDLALYKTESGKYVAHVEYTTHWQGELGYSEAWVIDDPVDVPTEFDSIDPTAHVQGYPKHEQYREKQASLMGWIEKRYRHQVGELLAQVIDLDERV